MHASKETMDGAEPGKEHAEMFPGSPENVAEKLENQEPETPSPSASLGRISREENHEKPEQPSPVSVLDPFFHEAVDSPDNKSMIKCIISFTKSNVLPLTLRKTNFSKKNDFIFQ